MAKVLAQIMVKVQRLMEADEYKKLRYAGGKPSLPQLKKWKVVALQKFCKDNKKGPTFR
ncbi:MULTISPECIES: hypothetical protein [unclassified Pseudomonas]|uniref:hypothetical protein n=1 Tax=unclassified Pseudomonas TaxID=196821 RepID=UPI00215DF7ED|nr:MULTISPECIES: hypothetical protein [unclassified Pseudomonas]UVM48250.1 hypothetical protein LOY38_17775 [Pseudomonas sp. B21-015]WPN55927.1 hypothetical protein QMK51_17325 [Pseudomonas sp. P9_31]